MQLTDREAWLLNFYRNSELHGALLMGKLARAVRDRAVLRCLTEHCATEAHHAALLTDLIDEFDAPLDPHLQTIQERYCAQGGIAGGIIDSLVLSDTLEKRVLLSYRKHLGHGDAHPRVMETLTRILHEMEEEENGEHAGWIERELKNHPHEAVEASEAKWRAVDERVAAELHRWVDEYFIQKVVPA